jgi:predicted phage tail protein
MVRFLFVCLVLTSSSACAVVTTVLKSCKKEIKEAQEKIQIIKKNKQKAILEDQLLSLDQWYRKQANNHITLAGAEGAQEKLNAFSTSCEVMTDALDKKIEGFQGKVVKSKEKELTRVVRNKRTQSINASRNHRDQKKRTHRQYAEKPPVLLKRENVQAVLGRLIFGTVFSQIAVCVCIVGKD